ncbi:Hsp20/alpha crystallin family protein [Oscillatoria sp. FACHB-1406]|uniref:Hsp20/alpha crystallin family protein n=1 Tax=Oscillatoria sp. FACHB-1406 TaxID=2692846 RepID=UPI001686A541|nr:Hsp20/alpha crystallin family protein [Oscillatoria sp. FACHB-1406]MBD2577274.1 Hsp20/alpha crystallin family protein [Oscillatoria sp. FACHB-1406]
MLLVRLQPTRSASTVRRYVPQPRLPQTIVRKPAVELENRGNELILRAAIPGMDAKDLDIHVARQAVAISGEYRNERRIESDRVLHSEFRYGKLERVIRLPFAIDNTQVSADFSNGVLTLTLPKASAIANRAVKVELTPATAESQPQLPETELPEAVVESQPQPQEVEVTEPAAEAKSQPINDETGDVWAV